jgi:hypothetical protein
MAAKRFWMLGLIPVALAGVAIAGVRSYCTRPCCVGGIPARDYQHQPVSRPEIAVSRMELRLATPANNRTTKEIKYYQLDRAPLTIDHCSISQVVLQMHDNGVWVMSLKADQNRQPEGEPAPAVTQDGRFTAHLKRNLFIVKVRCYGASKQEPPGGAALGRPVLFELEPMEFWVQRGRPFHFWQEGYVNCPKGLRELVDRIEIEFSYR